MHTAERVHRIAEETGCTSMQAAVAVEALLAVVKADLQQGTPVILCRCRTLHMRVKHVRVGCTPQTGDVAAMAARRAVRFTAGATLTHRVEGGAIPMA